MKTVEEIFNEWQVGFARNVEKIEGRGFLRSINFHDARVLYDLLDQCLSEGFLDGMEEAAKICEAGSLAKRDGVLDGYSKHNGNVILAAKKIRARAKEMK